MPIPRFRFYVDHSVRVLDPIDALLGAAGPSRRQAERVLVDTPYGGDPFLLGGRVFALGFFEMRELGEIIFVVLMAIAVIAFRLELHSKLWGIGEDLTAKERAKILLQLALGIGTLILAGILIVSLLEG